MVIRPFITSLAVVLTACTPSPVVAPPGPGSRSNLDESQSTSGLALTVASPEPQIDPVLQEQLGQAHSFRDEGELGLALVLLDQVLAAEPSVAGSLRWFSEASLFRETVRAEATAQVRAQLTAIAEAARADATAAALAEAEAKAARVRATVTAYARVAPKGTWCGRGGGVDVCANSFNYFTQPDRFSRAPSGMRFVAFGVYVENKGTRSIHVSPLNVTLVDQAGETYSYESVTFSWCASPMRGVNVAPGNYATGCIVFMTDARRGPATVIYRTASLRGTNITVDLQREPDEPS